MNYDSRDGLFQQDADKLAINWPKEYARSKDGYIRTKRNKKSYLLHRIIWEELVGPIPQGMEIDHINGVRTDCRLENLRCVTRRVNMRNLRMRIDNTSGITGIKRHSGLDGWESTWWCQTENKQKSRFFSDSKHGSAFLAMIAAAEHREKILKTLDGYTERHGKEKTA